MLRIDLGGGRNPKPGFVTVDRLAGADHVVDFEQLHPSGLQRLPFADDSVDEIYTSHCLEHLDPYKGFLWEIARVCKVGGRVEIRVPHWLQQMAHCAGHKHAVSPEQVRHWCELYIADWWQGSPRRLRLVRTEYIPGGALGEARRLFPEWTDEERMRFVPDACHENVFYFKVVPND